MKNIVNYLDEYLDDEGIYETIIKNKKDINKDRMKAFKRDSCEEEIYNHGKPIKYNHTFKDKTKYTRKNKHKNNY
jgi:hypothetical protein